MRLTKVCKFSNGGTHYNVLPAILVTPMIQVARFVEPTPATEYDDPQRALQVYPVVGHRIGFKFWVWHFGIEVSYTPPDTPPPSPQPIHYDITTGVIL